MKCCPTCRRPYPPKLDVGGILQQKLVNLLLERPDGMVMEELVDRLYAGEPNGAPLWASRSINVMAHRLNKKLPAMGYKMISTKGRGSRYKVVKLDADTVRQPAPNRHARGVARVKPAITASVYS